MGRTAAHAGSNPFSTRAVRPGAIPFRFPPSSGPELVVDRLARQGWWGEITGPHGSGKSTLLETLIQHLLERGRQLVRFTLHTGQRSLPMSADSSPSWDETTQVVVDGYEQLGWPSRWSLKRRCRRRGCGLLVTAHGPVGLPPLFQTQVTRELAQEIVLSLLPPDGCPIDTADIDHSFTRHQGNLRETIFDLYDVYERGERSRESEIVESQK